MRAIGPDGQKWLKRFHILFGCTRPACHFCLTLMALFIKPTDGFQFYCVDMSKKFIDDVLVGPAATGSLTDWSHLLNVFWLGAV